MIELFPDFGSWFATGASFITASEGVTAIWGAILVWAYWHGFSRRIRPGT